MAECDICVPDEPGTPLGAAHYPCWCECHKIIAAEPDADE